MTATHRRGGPVGLGSGPRLAHDGERLRNHAAIAAGVGSGFGGLRPRPSRFAGRPVRPCPSGDCRSWPASARHRDRRLRPALGMTRPDRAALHDRCRLGYGCGRPAGPAVVVAVAGHPAIRQPRGQPPPRHHRPPEARQNRRLNPHATTRPRRHLRRDAAASWPPGGGAVAANPPDHQRPRRRQRNPDPRLPKQVARCRLHDDGFDRLAGPVVGGASAVRRRPLATPFPRRLRHRHGGPPQQAGGAGGRHRGGGGIPLPRLHQPLGAVPPGELRAGHHVPVGQAPAAVAERRLPAAPPAGLVAVPPAEAAMSRAGPVPGRGCPNRQPAAARPVAKRRGASAGGAVAGWGEAAGRARQPAQRRAIRRGNPRDRMIRCQPWCPSMTAYLTAGGSNGPPSTPAQNTPRAGRRARWSSPQRLFRGPPALRHAAGGGPAAVMRGSAIPLKAAAIRSTGSCFRYQPPRRAAGTGWPGRGASDRRDTRRR